MKHFPLHLSLSAFILTVLLAGAAGQQPAPPRKPDVIYVPTPHEVVAVMLRLAELDSKDVLYDLGCGDGRIPIMAAKEYGARAVGVDIDPQRIKEARENVQKEGVTTLVRIVEADLFETDLREATAVTLYLLPDLNLRLRPKLLEELKPGTPIVSHAFAMGDWPPEEHLEVQGPERRHTLYKWRVPGELKKLPPKQSFSRCVGVCNTNNQDLPGAERMPCSLTIDYWLRPKAALWTIRARLRDHYSLLELRSPALAFGESLTVGRFGPPHPDN